MSTVGQVDAGISNNYEAAKAAGASKPSASSRTNYGNTIGDVKLSDKAAKYYDDLKKKFFNMDFVLVSNDEVEGAEQKANKFGRTGRTLVLIDAEKIEKMAEDESFRKKYENIISSAAPQLEKLQEQIAKGALGNVKTVGIKVDDKGNTSYFAVVDKSLAAQKDRIEKLAEKKAQEKRDAKKEAAAKAAQERLGKTHGKDKSDRTNGEQLETISASSVEELIKKINDSFYAGMSDNVRTDQERQLGTQVDFRL